MLTVTNIEEVNEAFEAKTPRPIRDVMLEIYPDATEDANGRFHAPYDGYECQFTGNTYRAGEYLPMEEPEDGYAGRVMGNQRHFPEAVDLDGNAHEWNGTRAQNIAAWGVLIAQSRTHDAARSQYVGTIGSKISVTVTVEFVKAFVGYYGNVFIHIMKDESGNVIVYKGGKKLSDKNVKIKLTAKVKSHGERECVKQTVVERPKAEIIS